MNFTRSSIGQVSFQGTGATSASMLPLGDNLSRYQGSRFDLLPRLPVWGVTRAPGLNPRLTHDPVRLPIERIPPCRAPGGGRPISDLGRARIWSRQTAARRIAYPPLCRPSPSYAARPKSENRAPASERVTQVTGAHARRRVVQRKNVGNNALVRPIVAPRRVTDRFVRIKGALLGERPIVLLWLAAPTALAFALDLTIRAGPLAGFATQAKLIYGSSLLISAAFWVAPLWLRLLAAAQGVARRAGAAHGRASSRSGSCPSRPARTRGRRSTTASSTPTSGATPCASAWRCEGPSATGSRRGAGRGSLAGMLLAGVGDRARLFVVVRRAAAAPRRRRPAPARPHLLRRGRLLLDRPGRQPVPAGRDARRVLRPRRDARPPDVDRGPRRACGKGCRSGSPAPASPAERARAGPTSCSILTESVRADAMLLRSAAGAAARPSSTPSPPDRVPLGKLTSQTPNTFSACMVLWTGLSPDADFHAAHSAPGPLGARARRRLSHGVRHVAEPQLRGLRHLHAARRASTSS